jgi:hypothetical protein
MHVTLVCSKNGSKLVAANSEKGFKVNFDEQLELIHHLISSMTPTIFFWKKEKLLSSSTGHE